MTLTPRIFRLFVSSTFSDFTAERQALQREVFPKLERYCAERGAHFQAVDLRWGITEEAQREHDTMRICLEEVRRCQHLSPRPNFAVLLGDRYGWEPVPARIPREHWALLQASARVEEWPWIEASYRLDLNAIPPVYCLDKGPTDAGLLQAIRYAASDFQGAARLPYFASATHQEIVLGALSAFDERGQPLNPEKHVHVYVRHLAGLPKDAVARAFIDWDPDQGKSVDGARDKLQELKSVLRHQLPDQVHDLRAAWNDHGDQGRVDEAYLERFCDLFLEHQTRLIDVELASLERGDEWQWREYAHQQFANERAQNFAGRAEILQQIARYTAPRREQESGELPQYGGSSPLIILGAGGSGKSALLAKAAIDATGRAQAQGTVLVQRYVGGVPGSESLMALLGTLIVDISRYYGQPEPSLPDSAKALAEAFRAVLEHASPERPLIVLIDALDQLEETEGAWALGWLPQQLPEHVRIVVSARADTGVAQAAQMHSPQGVVNVHPMTPDDGAAMLESLLSGRRAAWFNAGISSSKGRRLTPEQCAAVLAAFNQSGSPLWLKLAYEEAVTWASWDSPRQLPTTVQGLINDLIDHRLIKQEKHPKVFTERAVAYLTAGRLGLSESELGRALGTDKAVRYEFEDNEKTQKRWSEEKQLPPILWSRLFFDLQPYFGLVQVDGALLIRWFHREFTEALGKRYLSTSADRGRIHGWLAETFMALDRELRSGLSNDNLLFKSTDAAGQQVSAAMRRVTEQPWQLAQAGRLDELQALITDFGFCMGKCAANRADDLLEDFSFTNGAGHQTLLLSAWKSLLAEKAHLLRRGDRMWPAHKILLQIASEHADDSTVTHAAEAWLDQGHCDWVWLRNRKRPKRQALHPVLAVLEGHTEPVEGALVMPDGRLLSWSSDGTLRMWDCNSGAQLVILEGHTGPVEGALVMPDGRLLSWSGDGTLRLWDCNNGVQLVVMRKHRGRVSGVQVLPDGRLLSWSWDKTLRLWDSQCGEQLAVLEGHKKAVNGAQVLPDGRLLSWSQDNTLRLWDGESGAMLVVLEGHTDSVEGARAMPDGRLLSWSQDNTLRLWLSDGMSASLVAVLAEHTKEVEGAQVLADGRLLSWSWDGTLRLWDAERYRQLTILGKHKGRVNGVEVLPDGRLLSWSIDGILHFWDCEGGAQLPSIRGHRRGVDGVQVLPDDRLLLWSRFEDTLRLMNGTSGATLAVLEGHTGSVKGARVMPDGRFLSWSRDNTLRVWDGSSVEERAAFNRQHISPMIQVRPLSGGRLLSWNAEKIDRNSVSVLDSETGALHAVLDGPRGWFCDAVDMPNGRLLSWSSDNTMTVWNCANGVPIAVLEGHTAPIAGARVLSDGRLLSWSDDKTLRLWDGQSGAMLKVLQGHTDWIKGAKVLPDGRLLSWSSDNTLRIWDCLSGASIAVLEGHTRGIDGAEALPDGRLLSWSRDGTLRLWDCEGGTQLAEIRSPRTGLDGVRVMPDGSLLTWSLLDRNRLCLWDSKTGALRGELRGHTAGIEGAQVLPDGHLLTWSSDKTLRLWDGQSGVQLGVFPDHWVHAVPFPSSWELLEKVGGSIRNGDFWFGSQLGSLYVTDRREGWTAHWHGQSPQAVDASAGLLVASSGRELLFLSVMEGAVPRSNVSAGRENPGLPSIQLIPPQKDRPIDIYTSNNGWVIVCKEGLRQLIFDAKNGAPVTEWEAAHKQYEIDQRWIGELKSNQNEVEVPRRIRSAVERDRSPFVTSPYGPAAWDVGGGRFFRWDPSPKDGAASLFEPSNGRWRDLPQMHHHQVWYAAGLEDGAIVSIGLTANIGTIVIYPNPVDLGGVGGQSHEPHTMTTSKVPIDEDTFVGIASLNEGGYFVAWPVTNDGCAALVKWSGRSQRCWGAVLEGSAGLKGVVPMTGGRFVSLSRSGEVRLWYAGNIALRLLQGAPKEVTARRPLPSHTMARGFTIPQLYIEGVGIDCRS
jgi:WD40 repeat protein